ncbi:MAG: aminotransferase class IV [Gemmatimonadota bacterium]
MTAAVSLAWVDGRVVAAERAVVPAADRGFLLGDGLFETLRVRRRRAFRLEAHLRRMAEGSRRLGIPLPAGIREAVDELLEAARPDGEGEAALRVTLTRGSGGEGLDLPPEPRPRLVATLRPARPLPERLLERGLGLRCSDHRLGSRSALAGIKSLAYLPNVLARAEARAAGADDALLLDDRDRVVAASASNVFWVGADGELRTPSPDCGILAGITRAAVLDLVAARGIPSVQGTWTAGELSAAREAFTTSSLRGIAPVTRLEGLPVGDGRVGALTRRIRDDYEEIVRQETA